MMRLTWVFAINGETSSCAAISSSVRPAAIIQQFGLGPAVAILLDAVVIRCLIAPAVMEMLGTRAWWLPPVLARKLPRLSIERPDHT